MSVVIFNRGNGQVSSFADPTLPANISFRLEGWGGFVGFKSIITRVTVAAKGNFQFLHSLGGQVFLYVFGDRVGQLAITGLAFDSICGDPAGFLGIENVLNYYSLHRAANRQTPLKLTIGAATTLSGYLLDINASVDDPKSRVWQFTLMMGLPPSDEEELEGVDEDDVGAELEAAEADGAAGGDEFAELEAGDYDGGLDTGGAGGTGSGIITADGYSPAGTGALTRLVLPFAIQ